MPDNPTVGPAGAFAGDGFERLARPIPADLVEQAVRTVSGLEGDRSARRAAGVALHSAPSGLQRLVMARPGPDVLALAEAPEVLDVARAALTTDEPVVWGAELLTKLPGDEGGPIGWHQDRPYFRWWDGPTATAWIALTEMSGDNGSVRYVVGSHRWGDRYDTTDFDRSPEVTRHTGPPEGESWTEVEVVGPAGTAVVHHPGTVHGSGPNLTDRPRRALALRLRSPATVLRPDTPRSLRRALEAP